ncbi:MAG: trypsin-like peptidase domain-containing protein [Kiritimatiellaeota bacterium]|nr:trypsin-like peptidase domain-containing protein [Kiritimatiellota bacterium]
MLCATLPAWPAAQRRTPVVIAVEKALPTVVNIGTEKLVKVEHADPLQQFRGQKFDEFFRQFFQQQMQPEYRLSHSLGSGVIIDPLGYILTNFHVIERASKIQVTLTDGRAFPAAFLAGDPVNDIALIKIEAPTPLAAVEFAADDDTMLAETVIALGNPFGLGHSVTVGVLSAKDREARFGGKVLYKDILQTDAAVNPGSSGGPLLNLDGQLIGLNVAIYQEAQNIGFAVPIKRMRELLTHWLDPRLLKKATLGFEIVPQHGKLVVTQVASDRKLAVAVGDEIIAVNRKPVMTLLDYERALLPLLPTHYARIGVVHGGATNEVVAQVLVLPKPDGAKLAHDRLGLELKPFSEIKGSATLARQGIAIAAVTGGGAAAQAGLIPGLVVARINGQDVTTLDDVGALLENVRTGETVTLVVVSLREQQGFLTAQSGQVSVKAE